MKISYNWLNDFIKTDLSLEEITDILTDIGLEVEGTETTGISAKELENFVVGEVLTCEPHPNADKLRLTTVDTGNGEIQQIVCGAPNIAKGQKVPVAKIGAVINDGKGNSFTIKKAKLRGEESNGMICSRKELRLSEDHSGIWEMDGSLTPGTPLADIIDTESDTMIEIGLTPNRADAMSHLGVARDLFAALQLRNIPAEKIAPDYAEIAVNSEENPVSVVVEDTENCPRYAGIYMKNVKVGPSPQWLQNRLKTIGLTPKNNIVDITNFILHGFGQPMHAFDADKLSGNKIVVKSDEFGGNSITMLDKTERKLQGDELLICDAEKPVAIAGVMGGLDSAVTEETKNIFLESAYFKPVSVRKTSKNHGINSDSSFRFERGTDPNLPVKALQAAVAMIADLAGGQVVGQVIDVYEHPVSNHTAVYNFDKAAKLMGSEISPDQIKNIFNLLEINILSENEKELQLEIPTYRVDVTRQADLVEEILRIYGYNTVENPGKMSMALVPGDGFNEDKIENMLADTLVSFGFNEAMNLSMHKKQYNDWLGFDEQKSVNIINSLSLDLAEMRRSLLPGLLENIDFNIKRKQENIKLFEIGNYYERAADGFKEEKVLSLIVSGNSSPENWHQKSEKASVFYLKGILQHLFAKTGLQNLHLDYTEIIPNVNGIRISHEDVFMGALYRVPAELLKKFDIEQEVFYAEIRLKPFIKAVNGNGRTKFRELSRFPKVRRDLALLLDKNKNYQEIERTIRKTGGELVKNVNLFDVYEGDKLPENKKSYAVSVALQDESKTMNDKQIDAVMNQIIKKLEDELQAELRK